MQRWILTVIGGWIVLSILVGNNRAPHDQIEAQAKIHKVAKHVHQKVTQPVTDKHAEKQSTFIQTLFYSVGQQGR